MSEDSSVQRPHVLLAPHTGWKDVVEHFRLLMELGCDLDLKILGKLDSLTKINLPLRPYDLIIQMGLGPDKEKVGGLEFTRQLRVRFIEVPILVISGHDPSYAFEEVMMAGATDFLQRSRVDEPEEFVRKVKELLQIKTAPR